MEGGLVDENGMISYTFTHASDYIIAITDVEYTGQELNPKPAEPVEKPETIVPENSTADTATESESLNPNTNADVSNDGATQTSNAEGKTESIFINPLFYVGIAVALLVIVFVVFTVIKKKNK